MRFGVSGVQPLDFATTVLGQLLFLYMPYSEGDITKKVSS